SVLGILSLWRFRAGLASATQFSSDALVYSL
ncbi:MAG: hypothetical protein RLZZ156_2844, partial [Deinococcota bacterium]